MVHLMWVRVGVKFRVRVEGTRLYYLVAWSNTSPDVAMKVNYIFRCD